jgi:alcohol dehydrogenase
MLAYTYIEKGIFKLIEKPKPTTLESTDAIVKITLASICSSDIHIKHGSVPRAVPGITVGHEMVGIVEEVGSDVTNFNLGDRVTVNVETFCGKCFFAKMDLLIIARTKTADGRWVVELMAGRRNMSVFRLPIRD